MFVGMVWDDNTIHAMVISNTRNLCLIQYAASAIVRLPDLNFKRVFSHLPVYRGSLNNTRGRWCQCIRPFHSHELLKSEKLSLVVSLLLFCSGLRKYAAIEFWRSLALQRGPVGHAHPKFWLGGPQCIWPHQ